MNRNEEIIKSKDLFEKGYRYFGRKIANLLYKTPITANQVTVFRGILFLLFCLPLAIYPLINLNEIVAYLIFVVGIQIWDILDCTDGTLARKRKKASVLGEYYETLIDGVFGSLFGVFGLCLVIGNFLNYGNILILYFYIALLMGFTLRKHFMSITIRCNFEKTTDEAWREEGRKAQHSVAGKVLNFLQYRELGILTILLLFSFIFCNYKINIVLWYFGFYAIVNNLFWLAVAYIQFKTLKKAI